MKKLAAILICLIASFSTLAQNSQLSRKELKETIENYFISDDVPVRYYSNILMQIQGNATPQDSAIILGLIDTLNTLISTWDVHLIPEGTANLILEINKPEGELYPSTRLGNRKRQEIIETVAIIDIPHHSDDLTRRKIIYHTILRKLVIYHDSAELKKLYPGCVFAETNYSDITFHPVDFQLLQGIYSKTFDNEMRNGSTRINLISASKRKLIRLFSTLIAYLVPLIVLLVLFQKGIFKKHNYIFKAYIKQGLVVVGLGALTTIIVSVSNVLFQGTEIPLKLMTILGIVFMSAIATGIIGLVVLLLMYYCERFILAENDSLLYQTVFPFLSTTFLPSFFLVILVIVVPTPKGAGTMLDDVIYLSLSFMSYFISVAILRSFLIYITRTSESLIHEKDVELAKVSEMHKQAELQSLRSKINPHFLYNSLNSIASLAQINPEKTEQMALALSDFFKYSINREQKQMNTIAEELEAVETYLEIEKVRFGSRLNYKISCPNDLCEILIPQLLIQPFVENAIKHGISKLMASGEVNIIISLDNQQLKIRVGDNGPAFPDGPLGGYGIRNTSERLNLLYGKNAAINWVNGANKYIEILLLI